MLVILVPATAHRRACSSCAAPPSITDDLATMVADVREELDEHQRQQDDPESIPALQVSHIDFSYGHVQVLFDVGFEVRRGEVLALLGTNGAGKSTILRVIAGLGTPSRGVVRLNGRTITYVSPESATRLGIHLLPGGKGVFRDMTVRENLEMAVYIYRGDRADLERRIQASLDLFPELAGRARTSWPRPCRAASSRCWPWPARCLRPRGADHRRALARPGADRGGATGHHHRGAQGSRA